MRSLGSTDSVPNPQVISFSRTEPVKDGHTHIRKDINYAVQGNRFISPFSEAIKIRNMKKIMQKSRRKTRKI